MSGTIAEITPIKLSKKQKIALTYLAKGYVPRRVAQIVNVKLSTVNNWIVDHELFKKKLEARLGEFEDKGADYRKRNNTYFLEKLNEEAHRRYKNGDLKDEDLKTIMALKSKVEGDIRADTPRTGEEGNGQNPQINIQVMINQLRDRYDGSTSKHLIDVAPESKAIEQGGE